MPHTGSNLLREAKEVSLDSVERELERSVDALEEQGITVQRNITSCSVVLSHAHDDQKIIQEVISTIAETRAGRIIDVKISSEETTIKTCIALMCSPTKKDQQLCTEVVSITISKRELAALQSLLFQFSLVGVLPVLFLFSSCTIPAELCEIIDTFDSVVFDGRSISEDVILYLSQQKKQLSDMVWILDAEWRYAVASAFSQRTILSHLERLTEIRVTEPSSASVSDLLLTGWLLHRLELSPEAALNNGYECRAMNSGKVLPLICSRNDSMREVSFLFEKNNDDVRVEITSSHATCLETTITRGSETHRSTIRRPSVNLSSCLKRHFSQPESSSNYKRALEKAFELYRLESGFRS